MNVNDKVPKFWTDRNGNLVPFSDAAISATQRCLRKYHLRVTKRSSSENEEENKHISSIKFEPSNFDMFVFDNDIPKFPCGGGKPLSKWWVHRYDWSKSPDFNNTLWLSKEICTIVISYLIDRSINLENDIVAMDKKEIKFVNKTWFSILNDPTYIKIIFPPISKLYRNFHMKKEKNKEIYHIFKEYVKLHYYYKMFVI